MRLVNFIILVILKSFFSYFTSLEEPINKTNFQKVLFF